MNIDKIPFVGKVNKTVNMVMVNFVVLGSIFFILGIMIVFFPKVLDILVAVLLFMAAFSFFAMAHSIYSYKSKYTDWLGE